MRRRQLNEETAWLGVLMFTPLSLLLMIAFIELAEGPVVWRYLLFLIPAACFLVALVCAHRGYVLAMGTDEGRDRRGLEPHGESPTAR